LNESSHADDGDSADDGVDEADAGVRRDPFIDPLLMIAITSALMQY